MEIKIQYSDGSIYTAIISEESIKNVLGCLLDDNSVMITAQSETDLERIKYG